MRSNSRSLMRGWWRAMSLGAQVHARRRVAVTSAGAPVHITTARNLMDAPLCGCVGYDERQERCQQACVSCLRYI